jgi:hypothetical protein
MDNLEADPMTIVCQLSLVLIYALAVGPWWTVSSLRVMRKPCRINGKSMMNLLIRKASKSALARGNIYFWAWMFFIVGVGMDILGAFALGGIVATLLR